MNLVLDQNFVIPVLALHCHCIMLDLFDAKQLVLVNFTPTFFGMLLDTGFFHLP